MGLLWRLVSPFVSTFNAAPTVKIHDPVLGVANRLLQAIVCCGIAVMLYTDPPLYTEAPNAKAKFFASSGTLAQLQAAPATYCSEGHLYGYGDEYCESTRTAGFGLFCEYGLTCANFRLWLRRRRPGPRRRRGRHSLGAQGHGPGLVQVLVAPQLSHIRSFVLEFTK